MDKTRMVQDKTNKILNLSNFLLSFFVILIITSYIFLLIRRVILIIDSSLGVFGSGGFLNRDILLTSKDILANFTKVFDSIQIFALCGILIAFILILSTNKYQKNLIVVVVNFSLMVIISLIRIILIHLEPGNVFLTGSINPASLAYYDYSFFIYSTDTLRIIIILLLIISTILFIKYFKQINETNKRLRYISPIILIVSLVLYLMPIIFAGIFKLELSSKISIVIFYIHYTLQSFLQLCIIFVFIDIYRKGKLIKPELH